MIHRVLHFLLQNLGLAGSLSVSTVSMTPCSAPRLTIVSALLCCPRSPPPRLVWPVGFARGSRLVTALLHFRCSDKCLHMKPVRWAWGRKYRATYLTRWTWSKCTRVFSVQVETCKTAGADFPKRTCPLTGICCSPLVVGCDRGGDRFSFLNKSFWRLGGYLFIYLLACLLCLKNVSVIKLFYKKST